MTINQIYEIRNSSNIEISKISIIFNIFHSFRQIWDFLVNQKWYFYARNEGFHIKSFNAISFRHNMNLLKRFQGIPFEPLHTITYLSLTVNMEIEMLFYGKRRECTNSFFQFLILQDGFYPFNIVSHCGSERAARFSPLKMSVLGSQ